MKKKNKIARQKNSPARISTLSLLSPFGGQLGFSNDGRCPDGHCVLWKSDPIAGTIYACNVTA